MYPIENKLYPATNKTEFNDTKADQLHFFIRYQKSESGNNRPEATPQRMRTKRNQLHA